MQRLVISSVLSDSLLAAAAISQVRKLNLGQKKAHLIEIQVNGGASASDKVDFAVKLFEKAVTVDSVFSANEMIDTIAITKVSWTAGRQLFGKQRLSYGGVERQ